MTRRFQYTCQPGLPRLAWTLEMSAGSPVIRVIHGPWVETHSDFFVEGAWRGPFEDGLIDQSDIMLGSGGRLEDDTLTVASASHTYERLHSLRTESVLTVSNSLPFLLAVTGEECDERYRFYDIDLMSFVEGPSLAVRSIPTRSGRRVRLHYCKNLTVDLSLNIREECKPPFTQQPSSFEGYLELLHTLAADVAANASSDARVIKYLPLATVSSGYDSPACAVLARANGARQAVTFTRARSSFADTDDSGLRIGQRLGLEVLVFDREEYRGNSDLREVEFLSVGTGGEDVVMSALEPALGSTLLFTGMGGGLWKLSENPSRSQDYRVGDPSGASLAEFRLRVGFVHFPVPRAHLPLQPQIQPLSRSREMAPWRRGGDYDRPIPRRIIEEAGIPREWFARSKKAITQPFYHGEALSEVLSPPSYQDFREFCTARALTAGGEAHGRSGPLKALLDLAERASWRLPRFRRAAWRILRLLAPTENAYIVHWSVNMMRKRYHAALRAG